MHYRLKVIKFLYFFQVQKIIFCLLSIHTEIMNSKTFRGKNKSSSTAFISLHFNKADEDQLEISYSETKKNENPKGENISNTSQSTLLMSESMQDLEHSTRFQENNDYEIKEENTSNSDFCVKSYWSRMSKRTVSLHSNEGILEDTKGKLIKNNEAIEDDSVKIETCDDKAQKTSLTDENVINNEIGSDISSINEIANDLSPAIEAAELGNEDFFESYINDELKKAKCEILSPNNQLSSSFISSDSKKFSLDQSSFHSESISKPRDTDITDSNFENYVIKQNIPEFEESLLTTIWNKCGNFINFARNNVKFHILIAILACLSAPIPSWLSGFFVGTILSSCIVYWLYKPQKNMKNYQNLNFLMPQKIQVAECEYDSGIFKVSVYETTFLN